MKRVNEIDSTGAKILGQISKKVDETGKYLLISYLAENPSLSESDRYKRLITYSSGVMFGEMAFLDGSPRSADVCSNEDSETYLLSPDEYAVLQ